MESIPVRTHAGRGGRRRGAGRPPCYREPLLRKTVTLPTSYVEQLTVLGYGNLSDGIRLLVESAYTSTGVPWLDPAPGLVDAISAADRKPTISGAQFENRSPEF